MTENEVQLAVAEIVGERDPSVKNLKLASLCSTVFRGREIELVVVGGSAIEFYTEGAYTSGDVDLCISHARQPLTIRMRQELMGLLGGKGGPRSWQVAGGFVDILGAFEGFAATPVRKIRGPYGEVAVGPAEELIVERILVAKYPQEYPPALECAQKLVAAALRCEVELDWNEVKRLANLNEYGNWQEVRKVISEQAETLNVRGPYDPNE